ncbi:MAG: hypothetical protein ACFFBD_24000, partial [Candidatus Hodarchaeota archaeon]
MKIDEIINRVEIERMYRHILALEGPKHPLDTPDKLNQAADYICREFKQYGLKINEHQFKVPGYDATFKNV